MGLAALDFYLKNFTIEMEVMHKLGERKAYGNFIKVYEKLGRFDKVHEFRHINLNITRELEKWSNSKMMGTFKYISDRNEWYTTIIIIFFSVNLFMYFTQVLTTLQDIRGQLHM